MQGLSVPAGMIIPPGVNGHAPELDQRLPYDPAAAKSLLAEAGYSRGFGVTLDCTNNYYINDEAICRAVAAQLSEIGITVSVNAQPGTGTIGKSVRSSRISGWKAIRRERSTRWKSS
jgi:peptide/nickel transport system substrate-binding protein